MNKYGYYTNLSSAVPLQNQWKTPFSVNPQPKYNAGFYMGEPFNGPHGFIPVIPTAYYLSHINLASANPPPGVLNQDIGNNRPGNNYTATNRLWYSNTNNNMNYGPFDMQCKNINNVQVEKI